MLRPPRFEFHISSKKSLLTPPLFFFFCFNLVLSEVNPENTFVANNLQNYTFSKSCPLQFT